jgi:hypothetical protein
VVDRTRFVAWLPTELGGRWQDAVVTAEDVFRDQRTLIRTNIRLSH